MDNGTWAFAVYTCSVHFVLSILFEHSDSDCLPLNHWYHPSKVYMKITWKCSQLLLSCVWLTRFCNRNTFWTILKDQKRVFHFQNCSYGPKSCFWCQWQYTGNIVTKPSQQPVFLNKVLLFIHLIVKFLTFESVTLIFSSHFPDVQDCTPQQKCIMAQKNRVYFNWI